MRYNNICVKLKFFKRNVMMNFSVTFWLIASLVILVVGYVFTRSSGSSSAKDSSEEENEYSSNSFWKKKNLNNIVLSAKEKLDLSWEFLYKITEIVLQKFSTQDQKEIEEAAKILVENGMKYQHVVDYAMPSNIALAQNTEKKQDQKALG